MAPSTGLQFAFCNLFKSTFLWHNQMDLLCPCWLPTSPLLAFLVLFQSLPFYFSFFSSFFNLITNKASSWTHTNAFLSSQNTQVMFFHDQILLTCLPHPLADLHDLMTSSPFWSSSGLLQSTQPTKLYAQRTVFGYGTTLVARIFWLQQLLTQLTKPTPPFNIIDSVHADIDWDATNQYAIILIQLIQF